MEILHQQREKGFWIVWIFCHPKQWISLKSKDEVSFFDLLSLYSVTVALHPFILFCTWSWSDRQIFYWCNLKVFILCRLMWYGQWQQFPLWWSFKCWESTENGMEQTTTEKPLLLFSFWTSSLDTRAMQCTVVQ